MLVGQGRVFLHALVTHCLSKVNILMIFPGHMKWKIEKQFDSSRNSCRECHFCSSKIWCLASDYFLLTILGFSQKTMFSK